MSERVGGDDVDVVVLLMTDVVGSTRLWAAEPDAMNVAMTRHHAILHGLIDDHEGWRPADQGEGDAIFAAFSSASQAVSAIVAIQRALEAEPWPTSIPLRIRAGVHAGEVIRRDGNLFGDTVNRCARVRGLGHGGQTLLSAALHELVRDHLPSGVTAVSLGDHRMKDLIRAEPIFQLDAEGLPSQFPPLTSLNRVLHNLPAQASPLLGREGDVAKIVAQLSENRMTTILGFGGMGKTRVSLQVGAELAGTEATADGVWFVDLSSVTEPARVPAELLEVLGVKEETGGAEATLLSWLTDKKLLLVLDNLEQVLGCAPLVARLLSAGDGVRVLTTSREALHVRGERIYPLAPLELPPADVDWSLDLPRLGTYAAVELFVSRARDVRPDFAITNDTAPAVAQICATLDGLPLAIELAAARVTALDPVALLRRLDRALSVLTRGGRDRPERHQTLRATIAWSYDALSETEKLLLERLSVFPGAAVLAAVESVCADDELDAIDLIDDLTSLVEKSLVTFVPAPSAIQRDGYLLLVSIREFAAGKLAERDGDSRLLDRLLHYCQAVFPGEVAWSEELGVLLAQEFRNVRVAFVWALSGGMTDAAATVAVPLASQLVRAHRYGEVEAVVRAALPGVSPQDWRRPRLLAQLAGSRVSLGEQQVAYTLFREVIDAARDVGDPRLLARHLGQALPATYRTLSDEESDAWVEEAQRALVECSDDGTDLFRSIKAGVLSGCSYVLTARDPVRAEVLARQGLPLAREVAGLTAQLTASLCWSLYFQDEFEAAIAAAEAAGDSIELGNSEPTVFNSIAILRLRALHAQGQTERGLASADEAFAVLLPVTPAIAGSLASAAAWVAIDAGDWPDALMWLDRAIELSPAAVPTWEMTQRAGLTHLLHGDRVAAALDLAAAESEPYDDAASDAHLAWGISVERAWHLADDDPAAAAAVLEELAREKAVIGETPYLDVAAMRFAKLQEHLADR